MAPVYGEEVPYLVDNAIVVQVQAPAVALLLRFAALDVRVEFLGEFGRRTAVGLPASMMQSLPYTVAS